MGRYAAKAAAGLIPAAAVARLGMPALGALVLLAVLILAFVCWVIVSQDRTNRVSQLLLARRGTPAAEPAPAVPPARTGTLKRTLAPVTGREKQKG
jgi:hypothetical protein